MIEKCIGFKVGEEFFQTIHEAQLSELESIFQGLEGEKAIHAASIVMDKKEQILNILTTTETSHPRARKANGATRKPRKAKVAEPDNDKVPPTSEDAPGVTVPGSGKYRGK